MQNYNYDEKRKPRSDNQSQEDWFIKFENGGKKRKKPQECLEITKFEDKWIETGADKSMNSFAEKAGRYMAPINKNDKNKLSTSQIRNVYGEIKRIQLKGIEDVEARSSFVLLKPKVAYAEGRNRTEGLTLFKLIFDEGWQVVADNNYDSKMFKNLCNLLEALLAYHKAYGGKD